MQNIIKADVYRIIKGKGMYISMLIITITLAFTIYLKMPGNIGVNIDPGTIDMDEVSNVNSFDEFKEMIDKAAPKDLDVQILAQSSHIYYFMIFLVFVTIGVDFSNQTVKNVISSGISRNTYYLSKLVVSIVLVTFLAIFQAYLCYFGNLLYNGSTFSTSLVDVTVVTLRQLPILYAFVAFLIAISVITKKVSLFSGITIPMLVIIELLVMLSGVLFNFDVMTIGQFQFGVMLKTVGTIEPLALSALLKVMLASVTIFGVSTAIGLQHFKTCTIK